MCFTIIERGEIERTPSEWNGTTTVQPEQMLGGEVESGGAAGDALDLRGASRLCYKRDMRELREWISEKMRRRPRRGPNESESTGKSGQELPANQPAPLRPNYPEAVQARVAEPVPAPAPEAAAVAESPVVSEPAAEPKMVVETQPDSLATPPAEQTAAKSPKGYVVLAIGLPGSGKTTWYKRRGVTPLSSDLLRTLLFDDISEQRYQGLVFSTLRSLLRARLIAKMPSERQTSSRPKLGDINACSPAMPQASAK